MRTPEPWRRLPSGRENVCDSWLELLQETNNSRDLAVAELVVQTDAAGIVDRGVRSHFGTASRPRPVLAGLHQHAPSTLTAILRLYIPAFDVTDRRRAR